MNYRHIISTHRHKFIIGAPIIFLVLINATGLVGAGNTFLFTPKDSLFHMVGDEVSVNLEVSTKSPINAAGGNVMFPQNILEALSVTRTGSVIQLWSEDPVISNAAGSIHWSGGIIERTADEGAHGTIFTMHFRALKAGTAEITITEGEILAHDGLGTNIISGSGEITLHVREQGAPSPDINEDGKLSLSDVNTLYVKTFSAYNTRYDLNRDKKVGWSDVTMLIGML
jgi:hypothetical protein